ncbi:recombinase [Xanthomonas phage XAJ2]|uniref:Recombinase n=1 Tax=Xanthomonas phage XAJ2 TaxID=1775249 RepID=A0A1I9L2G3_9CAUD|nr:recombinase [Xanthomonas phage XAJ2]
MQIKDLQPASALAGIYGAKCIGYGGPGSGKTPLIMTAPNPVLCVVEPGMLSMRRATNIPAFEAYTAPRIYEFFDWLFKSNESKNFDTVCVDSVSQMAEVILTDMLKKHSHGMKAYGEMSIKVMEILNALYYLRNKHMYLIAKQGTIEEGGIQKRRPFFPGQDLNVKVPHMFDQILHIGKARVPGVMNEVNAIRCMPTIDIMARDRSGLLAEFEPMDLAALFKKVMQ